MTTNTQAPRTPTQWLRAALPIVALLALALSGAGIGAAPSATPALDWVFNGGVTSTTRIGNTMYVAGGFTDAVP